MTGGMVLAVLMALGHMARVGQRVARPLRKGNLDRHRKLNQQDQER